MTSAPRAPFEGRPAMVFEAMTRHWESAMNHYLATGKILERAH